VSVVCRQKAGSSVVTVAVTPDGYADAAHEGMFVTPAERQMNFSQFLDIIDHKTTTNGIVYVQKQNSNFTEEFSQLSDDIDLQMTWATQTFGNFIDSFTSNKCNELSFHSCCERMLASFLLLKLLGDDIKLDYFSFLSL